MTVDEITVRIDKVVAEGDGLGRLPDGRVVFVERALPGELVAIRIVKQSKDYARAEIVGILEANDRRVEPSCPYVAAGCGGCNLQHAAVDLQRKIKHDIVLESLVRLGKLIDPRVFDCPDDLPIDSCRTTMRWAIDDDGALGFRAHRSHHVVPVDDCLVADPALRALRHSLAPVAHSGVEEINLRVAEATGEKSAWWEPNDVPLCDVPAPTQVGPQGVVHEEIDGQRLRVSAASFFQASPAGAAALVRAVRRAAGDPATWTSDPVIDLYGGVGLFAATVVPPDHPVIVVESNESAVADAKVNLRDRPARIIRSEVARWRAVPASVVIADPSRTGLGAAAVSAVAATRAPVVVLVSCDPASLGRDVGLLARAGYRFEYTEVLDLFPHTHHVEAVSRFVRDDRLSS